MDYSLTMLPKALEDYDRAVQYYAEISKALGKQIYAEIYDNVQVLKSQPYLFQKRYRSVRAVHTKKFNYSIYYQILDTEVIVIAILNQRENTNKILKRRTT